MKIEKGHTIPVLDHGFVRYIDHMGDDQRIVESARISYRSPSKGEEADRKLLGYLLRNKHTSPFEMVKVTLNVKMPIFVMRQWVRHRMQNLNEVSARYTQLPAEFYIPAEWRAQDPKNRQGSVALGGWNPMLAPESPASEFAHTADSCLRQHCHKSYELYEAMLAAGIAREMARMVLPINIYTEIYCCWDLKNLLHFISLRDDSHAQAEIQEYSRAIKQILREIVPWTMAVYDEVRDTAQDTERLNRLEALLFGDQVGNGLALFPIQTADTKARRITIDDLGDEDGSHLGGELTSPMPSLRQAIDALPKPV